jgi:hypothetical protein
MAAQTRYNFGTFCSFSASTSEVRHSSACLTLGRAPVHILEEVGWAPGPVCTDIEKRKSVTLAGGRTPDHMSESDLM